MSELQCVETANFFLEILQFFYFLFFSGEFQDVPQNENRSNHALQLLVFFSLYTQYTTRFNEKLSN